MKVNVRQLRDGFIEAMHGIEPRLLVTLELKPPTTVERGKPRVEEFLKRVSRASLGKRWYRRPPSARLRAYGFPEHMDSNLHYHLVLGGPERALDAAVLGEPIWKALSPGTHFWARGIENKEGAVRYVIKNLADPRCLENFIAF